MARSTFKVLFYLKRQAEQNGKAPIMGRITIVRDIFVFCCFMGPAYADVKKLTHDDIHTDGQGDLWIVDHRQKTGTQFRVKLLPVAKRLVERYSRLRLPGNKVFPVKDRDSMNMSLRHVARHAGLSFNPTMHEARHTFFDHGHPLAGCSAGDGQQDARTQTHHHHPDLRQNHQRQDRSRHGCPEPKNR